MARNKNKTKGVSLAKGPAALIGMALLAYGISGLLFGGRGFGIDVPSGTVNGETWLGLEVNGWSNLLFIAGGALLLLGAPLHWGAKTMSLIVGLALGAASVIALVDGDDVLGIFAANGLTKLVWGVASAVLLILALLPRVGRKDKDRDGRRERELEHERERRMVDDEPRGERRFVRGEEQAPTTTRTERLDDDRSVGRTELRDDDHASTTRTVRDDSPSSGAGVRDDEVIAPASGHQGDRDRDGLRTDDGSTGGRSLGDDPGIQRR